jgi:hypothetical protein
VHVGAGCAVVLVAAGLFVGQAAPYLRDHPLVNEDVRSQAQYVEAHQRPGDVIIVDAGANFGFGYYFRARHPEIQRVSNSATTFTVAYPPSDRIVVMTGRELADVQQAFARARRLVAGTPADRIWIVSSHQQATEIAAWRSVVAGAKVKTLRVGPEPLLLVESLPG